MTAVALAVLVTACSGEDTTGGADTAPEIVTSSVSDGAADVPTGLGTITLGWSVPVAIANVSGITLSGLADLTVEAANKSLSVSFGKLRGSTSYTLSVASGAVVTKNGGVPCGSFSVSFTTSRDLLENPDISGELQFDIDDNLVNPSATSDAKALYAYLKNIFGSKTLSGSMASHTVGTESDDWVFAKTGKHTALACFDFMNATRQTEYQSWDKPYSKLVENAVAWAGNGGVVSCMWHWRDPSRRTDSFYCGRHNQEYTTFDASKIFDTQSDEYAAMIDDIDLVSGYLKQLQDAGVAVLWRPLHEAQGNNDSNGGAWFWWGNGSGDRAAACAELWKVMYDRMVNVNGLNNLIWVWTNQITGTAAWYDECKAWYPGGETVDIIGIDIYDNTPEAGRATHIDKFKKCAYTADRRKMVALTESGHIPSAQAMHEGGDVWLWYMPWNGDFTEVDNGDYWSVSFADPRVVTREKINY